MRLDLTLTVSPSCGYHWGYGKGSLGINGAVGDSGEELLEVFGEVAEQRRLTAGTHETPHRFTVFEHDHRRDAHHVEAHCDVTVIIDVEFRNGEQPCFFGGNFADDRVNLFARPTPLGPEVDQYRGIG